METTLPPSMQEATEALAGNLQAAEAIVRLRQAQARLDDDPQAHALLEQLSQMQAGLRQKQAVGNLAQTEIDDLRSLQEQVQSNTVIMAHARAQQDAVNFLREINGEISQLLGINFAVFANRSTCC
jgi:cell fate (sporulation/competence/biofilm development) regulator YlbF (YheA/YmcA/DUF963 family)